MTTFQPLLAGLAAALFSASAMAMPSATLSYLEREGVTNGLANVSVWLRVSSDAPLNFSGTDSFAPGELSEFAVIDAVAPTISAACAGTFWPVAPQTACYDTASPWRFNFNNDIATSADSLKGVTLAPGEFRDVLVGSFAPQNGRVAPGTYTSSNFILSLYVSGSLADGSAYQRWFDIGSTCILNTPDCTFVRTVTAVPEPATAALLPLGLAVLAWRRRAQRTER